MISGTRVAGGVLRYRGQSLVREDLQTANARAAGPEDAFLCDLPRSERHPLVRESGLASPTSLLLFPTKKARHREPTAHARARYRCFLPDLAGLARVRRVRPMPDLPHSSKGEADSPGATPFRGV